jgi:serine/threonine-protein kinase RsbW
MTPKCEYSTLTIPNDPGYARVAAGYGAEIARIIGFDEPDLQAISEGVRQAVAAQMEYSFEPGDQAEIEVSCERIPEGLRVVLKDKGLPFDNTAGPLQNEKPEEAPQSSFGLRILGLKACMSEVLLHSLGTRGKEIVLIKHLKNKDITDYYAACDLEPYSEPAISIDNASKQITPQNRVPAPCGPCNRTRRPRFPKAFTRRTATPIPMISYTILKKSPR